MNEPRSPIGLIGAVLDEVEGLRQVDRASHLPALLLMELRAAMEVANPPPPAVGSSVLSSLDELEGRTISHVLDGSDVLHGDTVLVCSDGAHIVLDIDGDEDASITTSRYLNDITKCVRRSALVRLGLMDRATADRLDNEEKLRAAERDLSRAEAMAKRAQEELKRARIKAGIEKVEETQ